MKSGFIILILLFTIGLQLAGQSQDVQLQGTVSYISSQSIYVKFESTIGINPGDTLFRKKNNILVPALIVENLSSISCVCASLSDEKFSIGDQIISRKFASQQKETEAINNKPVPGPAVIIQDTASSNNSGQSGPKQSVTGRLSVSSYTGFSNTSFTSERMRYSFTMNARNINNSKISAETYLAFTHKDHEWQLVKDNIFNGLKIYSLALLYDAGKNSRLAVGRRINPNISSVGAIDGLQYEKKFRAFSAGVVAGTRPDYDDYGFNFNLLQYGAYLSYENLKKIGAIQSSVAFIEQRNSGKIDRRFAYFQHSNNILPNLYLFGSMEFDLYKIVNEVKDNSPRLSNLYFSLRYRFGKKLSMSASYTNRQNIIYYETYKDIIERLLATESTQGYHIQASYRPVKNVSVGINAGYRFQKADPKPGKNLYGYITYSNIPWIDASVTLSTTLLQTSYLGGKIYSLGISRNFLKGRIISHANYRYVDYTYSHTEAKVNQNMAELGLSMKIQKKMLLSLNAESTFEKAANYSRLYIQLSKSF